MPHKSYGKIYHIDKEECEGILEGECYIQEKIDGANLSVWKEGNEVYVGSRTQTVGTDKIKNGFRGAVEYINNHEGIKKLFNKLEKVFETEDIRLYGEWLCLSGDTIIRKVSGGRGGKGNFMTIKEMYEAFNTPKSWWKKYGLPSLYSLYQDKDIILPNKIKNIIKTGIKDVYEITTREGKKIKTSKDHPFFTQFGFVKLEEIMLDKNKYVLGISDIITEKIPRRLGIGSRKILKEQKIFKEKKGHCNNCGEKTSLELDHIDEDWTNNNIENRQVLCRDCHAIKSGTYKRTPAHHKGYKYRFDKIISIEYIGKEECYDITMEGGENEANFVAQDFIVHNCPHTITNYNKENYNHFYLFDIEVDGIRQEIENPDLLTEEYGIKTPYLFGKLKNPTKSDLDKFIGQSKLGPNGEGIVIKNPSFVNKFGNRVYAKMVSEQFKEDNGVIFGNNTKTDNEMDITTKFCDWERIRKIMNKIEQNDNVTIDKKHISQIIGMTWYDIITEEANSISKYGIVDFNRLKGFITKKVRMLSLNYFDGGEISVAFNNI